MGKRKGSKGKNNQIIFNEDRNEDCEGAVRQYKPIPNHMEKRPYETEEQFMRRLNRLVGTAINEAQIEEKYDVDFCPSTGAKNDLQDIFKTGKTISKRKQEKRKQRDKKRKEKKNQKKQLNRDEFKSLKDDKVKFGETVHHPPNLSMITKKFDEKLKKMRNRENKLKHFN